MVACQVSSKEVFRIARRVKTTSKQKYVNNLARKKDLHYSKVQLLVLPI